MIRFIKPTSSCTARLLNPIACHSSKAFKVRYSSSSATTKSTFSEEWARTPPTSDDQGDRIEFTIKIPKPIRPQNEPLDNKRARLLWSVRKRGILEADLLLSTFVDKTRLAGMSALELEQLDSLLEENDWDIYYWVTQAKPTPPEVEAFGFWADLVEHSKNKRKDILRMPELDRN
ncbi:Flavinator of succinate dehydrogenase-domain-containing protein [Obelidium mucronatum]|nr:Flavinator of succinate dehydrogenase-domain-containing protein [Obelidium mucronatum]KAI9339698.1 Flavinator of succinate dehydrogenase-domain-containing protein [Obelidium mucronatum]